MTTERKQINFTIVPDDSGDLPRTYANFCAISHSPFDFTLSFCEVMPLTEKDIQAAEADHVIKAPVRAKVAVPLQVVPNLIAALQEHMRVYRRVDRQRVGQEPGPLTPDLGRAYDPRRIVRRPDLQVGNNSIRFLRV